MWGWARLIPSQVSFCCGGGGKEFPSVFLSLRLSTHPPLSFHSGSVILNNACYIVQDYVSGGTLKRAVSSAAARKQGEPRPYRAADAAAWGADVARGLAYLHGANPVILHRDLKLENVLLTRRRGPPGETEEERASLPPGRGQTAQLADFGLAVAFVSPDIDSRRSQLMPLDGLGSMRTSSVGARLADPQPSTVAQQMARADRGQTMTDVAVKRAANALESALSAWAPGENGSGGGAGSGETAGGAPTPPSRTATPPLPPRRPRTPHRHRLTPANRHLYALTGKTGSYLYMAPCVTLCLPYNERTDLFSLGVVLWELFSGRTIASVVLAGAAGGAVSDPAKVAELYAHRVARGFRPPLPADWPERVKALVSACWKTAPADRPTAAAVADELTAMIKEGALAEWDAAIEAGADQGGADAEEDWESSPQCCVCF